MCISAILLLLLLWWLWMWHFLCICSCCPSIMEHASVSSRCLFHWQPWCMQIIVSAAVYWCTIECVSYVLVLCIWGNLVTSLCASATNTKQWEALCFQACRSAVHLYIVHWFSIVRPSICCLLSINTYFVRRDTQWRDFSHNSSHEWAMR